MPTTPRTNPAFRVQFHPATLAEDAEHSTPKARQVLRDTVRQLTRDGISQSQLKAWEDPACDGSRLPGCAKTYLPQPNGDWGMVFQLRLDQHSSPFLACLAFGTRHPTQPWQPSVYQVADRRLHALDLR